MSNVFNPFKGFTDTVSTATSGVVELAAGQDPVSNSYQGSGAIRDSVNPNLIPFGANSNVGIENLSMARDQAVKNQYRDVLASAKMLGARANKTGAY
jgi:hypothetical protein